VTVALQWFPQPEQRPQIGPTQEQLFTAYGTQTAPPDYPAVQAAAAAAIAAHCARLAGTTRTEPLWQAASSLDTNTLFGAFKINPVVISGSGATLDGGSFRVSGTIGQPATALLSASEFQMHDGFWRPAAPTSDVIFANGFDP